MEKSKLAFVPKGSVTRETVVVRCSSVATISGTDTIASSNPFAALSVVYEGERFIEPLDLVSISKEAFPTFKVSYMNEFNGFRDFATTTLDRSE